MKTTFHALAAAAVAALLMPALNAQADVNRLAAVSPGLAPNGLATWASADAALTAFNGNAAANHGFSSWRMPTANGVHSIGGLGCQFGVNGSTDCGDNVNTASSELAWMFHVNLGNRSWRDSSGNAIAGTSGVDFGLVDDGDFANLDAGRYWSGTSSFQLIFGVPKNGLVTFDFINGSQGITAPANSALGRAWLVHDGDIGQAVTLASANSVPAPGTLALAGLAAVLLAARRRKA
jgi:uncharacterized protein (TIGR03382 family)